MTPSPCTGVSGWIGERKDYAKVWAGLDAQDSEVFTLVWESRELLALNTAIASFMAQQVPVLQPCLGIHEPCTAELGGAVGRGHAWHAWNDKEWAKMWPIHGSAAVQAGQEVAKWAITHFLFTGLVAAFATPWILVSFSQVCCCIASRTTRIL